MLLTRRQAKPESIHPIQDTSDLYRPPEEVHQSGISSGCSVAGIVRLGAARDHPPPPVEQEWLGETLTL